MWCIISLLPSSFPEDAHSLQEVKCCYERVSSNSATMELGLVSMTSHQCFSGYYLWAIGPGDTNSQQTWFCFHASQRVQIPSHNCQELGFMGPKPRGPGWAMMAQVYCSRSPWWCFSTWGTFPSVRATGPEYWRSLGRLPFQLLGPS